MTLRIQLPLGTMTHDDPFCVRHGVPFDAFDGCWRCESDAVEREKAKREISNQKDAEISSLRAERARQNAETLDDGSDHAACVELADALGSGRYSRTQLRKAIAIERRSEP